jgi:hypothetical protein
VSRYAFISMIDGCFGSGASVSGTSTVTAKSAPVSNGGSMYYNNDRPHMSLRGDAPVARAVEPPTRGKVVALPTVGGLHHRYARAA